MRVRLLGSCLLAVALTACGGPAEEELETSQATAIACTAAQIDWSGIASDAEKRCDGPFEYGPACCAAGRQRHESCFHTHQFQPYVTSISQAPLACPTVCVEQEYGPPGCLDPVSVAGRSYRVGGPVMDRPLCRLICVRSEVRCSYPACNTTLPAAQQALASVEAQRALCKVTSSAPVLSASQSSNYTGNRTCTFTVTNAVTSEPDASGIRTVNRCDNTVDDLCPWDESSRLWEACNPGRIGTQNPDTSTYAQVNSAECSTLPPLYSAPGQTLQGFNAAVNVLQRTSASGAVTSRCMTGEDLSPLGASPTDASVRAKWDAMATRASTLPSVPADPNLARKVLQHREQLFELFGERLDGPRQVSAQALYEANPTVTPACSATDAPWAPPAETSPPTALKALQGQLVMCDRILQRAGTTTAEKAAAAELADDMALACALTTRNAKSAAAGRPTLPTYTSKAGQVSVDVMSRGFTWLTTPPGGGEQAARLPILQRRAWTLGQWYDNAKTGIFSSPDGLWANTSAVAGALWEGLASKDRLRFDTSGRTEADIETLLLDGLATDRELVTALHTNYLAPGESVARPPLRTAPALYLVGDLARNVTERLDAIAPFHDLACRYLGCAAPPRRTEAAVLYDLIGALDGARAADGSSILSKRIAAGDVARTAAPLYFSTWDDWRGIFDLIDRRHADVIQPAVLDAAGKPAGTAYDPAFLANSQDGQATPLLDLSASLKLGRLRTENFERSGLFMSPGGKSLPTGLLGAKIAQLDSVVEDAETNLENRIGAYKLERAALVQGLITEIGGGQKTNELNHRKAEIFDAIYDIASDDAGLKVTASMDQARFSDIGALIDELRGALAAQGASYTPYDVWVNQPVSGADARFVGTFGSLNDVALQRSAVTWFTSGLAGDIFNIAVSGEWQPTCALQAQNGSFFGVPLRSSDPQGMRFATTGPDGFSLTMSGAAYTTESHAFTKSKTWSYSGEVCGGATWTYPPADPISFLGGTLSFSVSAKACAGYSRSRTTTDATGHGKETRNSAAFAYGLRLPGTPFPDFPAGSLVAVAVRAGFTGRSEIVDAVVVQGPNTSVVLPEAADVYLVVNDAGCGNAGPDPLTLSIRRLRPASASVEAMAGAMAAVWTSMQSQLDGIVKQGRLLPDQANQLRNLAWRELRTRSGMEPTAFPPVVYSFFETWIDAKVVQVERAIELVRMNRDMDQLQRQVEAYDTDLDATARQGRLAKLVPYWTLQNLNLANAYLEHGSRELARMVREDLYPMAYLRYPEALSGLVHPDALLRLGWSNVIPDALATATTAVTTEARQKLDTAVATAKNNPLDATTAYAILRFPNPFNPPLGQLPGRTAADARADAMWEAIFGGLPFQFKIFPEDLYKPGATDTLLGCNLVAPAISRMALYVSSADGNLVNDTPTHVNYTDKKVPTVVGQDMDFPTGRGTESFLFGNGDWLSNRTRLLYGPSIAAQYWLDRLPASAFNEGPAGISPFGTFSLDPFGGLAMLYPDASEIVVVMQVEARQKADGVNGVGTCPSR